ncbi:FecR family protein [Gelidibacter maritimus]|uniref:FecR domain-containing protein n=1 Tax=Gelidibacter maritimus TaxID=2761487 RepID=A0A7W2R326_9FLAO|nr:FecR family protein [Gelidibacter maritimus]MBA6152382.1 FecR domain-containing protein [Gelidibacter maritimus]
MTVKDFLENDLFIFYMLTKDPDAITYWDKYLKNHPEDKTNFEKALAAFKTVKVNKKRMSLEERKHLHNRIFINKAKPIVVTRRRRKRSLLAATVAVLVFMTIGIYTTLKHPKDFEVVVEESTERLPVRLITNNKTYLFSDNEVLTVKEEGVLSLQGEHIELNDTTTSIVLKVPYGKRSELVLADGSKLWINSGSTVKFPSKFNDSSRNIFIEGEIFIDVSKNQWQPFTVSTSNFDVNVYGTAFNVKAYEDSENQRVVLVEGAVSVISHNDLSASMMPNESLEITPSQMVKKTVDPRFYTSWKNGYLEFDETPIEDVLLELSRYYNVTFLETQNEFVDKTCTGKIYLSSNLEDVLETLSVLSSTSFKVKEK